MAFSVIDGVMNCAIALGERIGLYDAKRTELKIKSIGAVDCNKAQRMSARSCFWTDPPGMRSTICAKPAPTLA